MACPIPNKVDYLTKLVASQKSCATGDSLEMKFRCRLPAAAPAVKPRGAASFLCTPVNRVRLAPTVQRACRASSRARRGLTCHVLILVSSRECVRKHMPVRRPLMVESSRYCNHTSSWARSLLGGDILATSSDPSVFARMVEHAVPDSVLESPVCRAISPSTPALSTPFPRKKWLHFRAVYRGHSEKSE